MTLLDSLGMSEEEFSRNLNSVINSGFEDEVLKSYSQIKEDLKKFQLMFHLLDQFFVFRVKDHFQHGN